MPALLTSSPRNSLPSLPSRPSLPSLPSLPSRPARRRSGAGSGVVRARALAGTAAGLLAKSHHSTGSWLSAYSAWSGLSFGSFGSFASFLSVGSIGSSSSILSIGSTGSILSIGSAGSVLSVGASGRVLNRRLGELGATSTSDGPGARDAAHLVERGATVLGTCALVAGAVVVR